MIDVHTHLFNLKYLPISGVMQSRKVPEILADAVAFILHSAMENNSPILPLTNYSFAELNVQSSYHLIGGEILKTEKELLIDNVLFKLTPSQYNNAKVQAALNYLEPEIGEDEPALENINQNLQSILISNTLESSIFPIEWIYQKLRRLIKRVFEIMKSGWDWLRWFRFLMRSETKMYQELIETYGDKVDYFVHHLLDMDNYFKDDDARFDYVSEQIPRMLELTRKSNGRLICFIGFDPKRKDSLKIVKQAIASGARGVKFYPPLGYKPIGNRDKSIDDKNKELFSYCIDHDIPVFTHCTPKGFESSPNKSGKNADPKHWLKLLKDPDFSNLRLCLGHAGGVSGWFEANTEEGDKEWKKSYAANVYKLCTNYPNVFCEIGFLSDIYDLPKMEHFAERLIHLFNDTKVKYPFTEKIMYGSDWHLLFNEGLESSYLNRYEELFNRPEFVQYERRFFDGNARNYLNLTPIP